MSALTPLQLYDALERRLDPPTAADAALIDPFAGWCAEALPPDESARLEAEAAFPAEALRALLTGPVGAAITPVEQGGALSWDRLMRVCSRLAAHDLGVTLCLGGVVLGAVPVIVAGDAAQRRRFFASLRAGGLAGLALSEWDHGSDLLRGETVAEPRGEGFRLTGHKRPTNNGSRADHLVVLARTGEPEDPFGASLFLLERGVAGLERDAPVGWIGDPGMDLSGVVLDGVEVGPESLLGKVGQGFVYTRRALEITRSGVACMAVGAHAAVVSMALEHARSRHLYGAPIAELGGVRRILASSFARLCLAAALGRRAARSVGRHGVSARPLSSAAKLMCPALLEESVAECGALLGTRSLTTSHPFHRLRRDAPILGIFDGSSQLQLDELWRSARTWPAEAEPDPAVWAASEGFDPWAEDAAAAKAATPPALLHGHPELAAAARALVPLARGARAASQHQRFRISEAIARLQSLGALAEVGALRSDALLDRALDLAIAEQAPALAGLLSALGEAEAAGSVLGLAADAAEAVDGLWSALAAFRTSAP